MKKILALILALCILCLTLTACGPQAAAASNDEDSSLATAIYRKTNGAIEEVTITGADQTGTLEAVTLTTNDGKTIIVGIDSLFIKRAPVHIPNPDQRQKYIDKNGLEVKIKQPSGWITTVTGVYVNNSNAIFTDNESVQVSDMCRIDTIDAEYFVSPNNVFATSK